jgi:hypothetical protein
MPSGRKLSSDETPWSGPGTPVATAVQNDAGGSGFRR